MCSNVRVSIEKLGGPTAFSRRYGYSTEQVCNWYRRGVPFSELMFNKEMAEALASVGYVRTRENKNAD